MPDSKQKTPRSVKPSGVVDPLNRVKFILAEREGFEPSVPFSTPDFESGTIDHSATSPQRAKL